MLHGLVGGLLGPKVRHCWALALVALVEIYLFCGFHHDRWYKSLAALGRPRARTGEGLVIRCDGLGYYAWLRSTLIDGDWSFDNEFDEFNVTDDWVPYPWQRTELGRRANPWSVGPACFWAMTVVPGHFLISSSQAAGHSWPADGYSLPYQLLVGVSTLLLSIVGLGFLYAICCQFADCRRAAVTAGLLTLGTTIVYYSAIEVSMAHGIATAAVAIFVFYWMRSYASLRVRRWLLVGMLLGAVTLIRWQLATLAVLPVGEVAWNLLCKQNSVPRERGQLLLAFASAVAAATLAFSPQLIAWRIVYGQWLASPIPISHNWLRPAPWQVLFSQDRGFFYWTPLPLLACLGYFFFVVRRRRKSAMIVSVDHTLPAKLFLLISAFAIQVYVLASVWGPGVYLGAAYGFRHLTESVVLLAPGLALLFQRVPARAYAWLAALCCLVAAWNLTLLCQYRYSYIPPALGVDPAEMLANALRLIQRKRLLLVGQILMGPLLLWLLAGTLPQEEAVKTAETAP
jgi:hypothetical protein